jgi:FkbM family methyltransferase
MNRTAHKIINIVLRPLKGLGLRRFSIVRKILGFLKQNTAVVRGHKIYLNPSDFAVSEEISAGGYESMEMSIILKLVRETDTVVDLGANIGYFTVLFCDVARAGTVYAFEPSHETFGYLKKNIESNGFHNASLHETAIGDRDGEAQLFINEYNKGDNRVYPSFGAQGVSIRMSTLDSIIPTHTKVDFIKMDIQGFEVHALKGMQRTLRENHDLYMLVECWPKGLKRAGNSALELIGEIESLGFSWCMIDDEKNELRAVSKEHIVEKFPADKDDYANLLCWRGRALPDSLAIK